MIRRPPRSTRKESSAASDVYKRQVHGRYMLAAFYGCAEQLPIDDDDRKRCANVFFIESHNRGQNWVVSQRISLGFEALNFALPVSAVHEKNTGNSYVLFAVKPDKSPFHSEIHIYCKESGKKDFKRMGTLPNVFNLASFSVGYTIDNVKARQYLHVFFSDANDLHYTRSFDAGKTWSNRTAIATGVSTGLYNFVVIDPTAGITGTRSKIRSLKDAIGICRSEEEGVSIVVSGHVGYYRERGYFGILFRDRNVLYVILIICKS
eukprot:TRINITY_DN4808_c0_g1_i14.p1 TRINITY_DN4808_c0_g1~~TRINITY_DN4808_c0_g1_i14.p1  ORF type:complete len:271 (+),score=33.87 TRINITY_DN4808_c0_g1_i14:25-813(+)